MARRPKTSPLEHLMELASKLSWKVCLVLAILGYLGFHYLSGLQPIVGTISPNTMGDVVVRQMVITIASILQYIVSFAILAGMVVGVIKRKQRAELLETRSGIESIREMTWQNFELLVGEAFKRQGYTVEERGGPGADGGIDLILHKGAKRTLVQCKRWKTFSINVSHVRELYGVMTAERASGCIFVSSGTYTSDALAFARGKPIRLIEGAELVQLIEAVQTSVYIKTSNKAAEPSKAPNSQPVCPLCNSAMVQRQAKKGANAGNTFWGCSQFPSCRGVRSI